LDFHGFGILKIRRFPLVLVAKQNIHYAAESISEFTMVDLRPNSTQNSGKSEKRTCLQILNQTMNLFEQFLQKIYSVCASRRNAPIEQILNLFCDIRDAENDLQLLKTLLDSAAEADLISVVSFWRNRKRIHHICKGLIQLGQRFSANLNKTFYNQICNVSEETSGQECIQLYQQYQNQLEATFSHELLTFISYYSSSSDLFEFLHSLTDEDISSLKEAGNDLGETLMDAKTIFDFANIKSFIDRTYDTIKTGWSTSQVTPMEINYVIACFEKSWPQEEAVNLLKCLESSSLSLTSIKHIYLTLTDKEQSKRRRISDILQKSSVVFVRIEHHGVSFDVNVQLPKEEKNVNSTKREQKITIDELNELRDRARLLEYSSRVNHEAVNTGDEEHEKEKLHNFIQFVGIIESIIETITGLYTAGNFLVSDFLDGKKTFSCIEGNYEDLKQQSKFLETTYKDWEIKLYKMYEGCPALTHLSGEEFWEVEDYVCTRSSFMHPGYHLLKYMNVNVIPNTYQRQQRSDPEGRSRNLTNILSIHQRASIIQQVNTKLKCLIVETTEEGTLRAILSIFSFTRTTPSVSQLFYCTANTKWFQVHGFIYRCFYSQSYNILIRPELLSQSIQDQSVCLVRSLIEQNSNKNYCIGIVTTTSITDQHLINGLQSMDIADVLRDYQLFTPNEFQTEVQKLIGDHHLFTSKLTGLGKSTIIRRNIELAKKKYVKFPITGNFDVDTLAKKLRSMYLELEGAAIHIDIGVTENMQQLNEIIYCLVLFGGFRLGNIAVFIPKDTPIYIEIDASPESGLHELFFLRYFQQVQLINSIDWNEFNTSNPAIQGVAHYLQAITSGTIANQNIQLSPAKALEAGICSRLIRNQFLHNKNPEFINWTQVSIMTAIMYRLFIGFSRCGYFLVEYVSNRKVRMDLILTLLQSSNLFTSVSVERVRNQQRTGLAEQSTALSEAIVRWDALKPFTMIFTSTDEPIFVYKKPSDVPQALREYFQLYFQAMRDTKGTNQINMFPDYTSLTHNEFFIKLASLSRKFFNKSICPSCYRQYEYPCHWCSTCLNQALIKPSSFDYSDVLAFQTKIAERLRSSYVLTPDNFIKMLLAYIRIQSKIPVLIMGETGKILIKKNYQKYGSNITVSRLWKDFIDSILVRKNTR
jgi:hypothetical protein